MTIDELIKKGCIAKDHCNNTGNYISGAEYEEWIRVAILYLENEFPNTTVLSDFKVAGSDANGNYINRFETMMGILKAVKEFPKMQKPSDTLLLLQQICQNFNRCVKTIAMRHCNRGTLEITDEYDVQDLLHGILRLFFNDVRAEENVPSYAGGNSRTDFFLPECKTFIETKMTRVNLKDKEIGEELLIDIGRYQDRCDTLICFIYDKANLLKNPYGLINDLEKCSTEELQIKVFISPI